MIGSYRITLWNANVLAQHRQELTAFLIINKIDIMLITETHFTDRSYIKIPGYNFFSTEHPDGTAHGGTTIFVRTSIKHHELRPFDKDYLQATSIVIEDVTSGPIVVAAVYCPPRHSIKNDQFTEFFQRLGSRFFAGGDYNAKHPLWGSRLTTTRGRELWKTITSLNCDQLSAGQPTYWPTDRRKISDVLDFYVIKGITKHNTNVKTSLDLSSDHTSVTVTYSSVITNTDKRPTLYTKYTNWTVFRDIIEEKINLRVSLKNETDIDDATEYFTQLIQDAGWEATPDTTAGQFTNRYPDEIKQKIAEKRGIRRRWQLSRNPIDKSRLNKAVRELKKLIYEHNNHNFEQYISNLSNTADTDYSLWKATRRINWAQNYNPPIRKTNGDWAQSDMEKSEVFAQHLAQTFTPFASQQNDESILNYLECPLPMEFPIKHFTPEEVGYAIHKQLNPKKSPGYDLVTGAILKKLPKKGIVYFTNLFNGIISTTHVPSQWKVAQIIMLQKPGKPPNSVTSYRPISLLPIMCKLFEKLLLVRMKERIKEREREREREREIIPEHQFGFRTNHSTVEQVNRVFNTIANALEEKKFCSAVFLDIQQAFDKVWHPGLLYKIKALIPQCYLLIKSYLSDRKFQVKYGTEESRFFPINSGVPQGSVLGPVLYTIFTADLPTNANTTIATYADDTAILSIHKDPDAASELLQLGLNEVQEWLERWRIKASDTKSVHVTFSMRRKECPTVTLNGRPFPVVNEVKYLGMHLDRRLT